MCPSASTAPWYLIRCMGASLADGEPTTRRHRCRPEQQPAAQRDPGLTSSHRSNAWPAARNQPLLRCAPPDDRVGENCPPRSPGALPILRFSSGSPPPNGRMDPLHVRERVGADAVRVASIQRPAPCSGERSKREAIAAPSAVTIYAPGASLHLHGE